MKFSFSGKNNSEVSNGEKVSPYRRLWRFNTLLTLVVAVTPLAIMTLVNYYQDLKSYRSESQFEISQILSNTKRTLEFIIQERVSALSLITNEKSFKELSEDEALSRTLSSLKKSFGGFVDLGIIDCDGNQEFYVGPYDLKGKNYTDQASFHEVSLRGVYVSDVFMGFRNFPHFVIAVKKEHENGDFCILRATFDMQLLNQVVYSIELDKFTDAFIINNNRILQTASMYYGEVLGQSDLDNLIISRNREEITEYQRNGDWTTFGFTYIEQSPFIFVVIKKLQSPILHWLAHRTDLIWFLVVAVGLILIFAFYRSSFMVNKLIDADQKRVKAFHSIEYTNKMATIGRMAASVAHEINNPLAIINEKAGLMRDMVSFTADYPKKEKTLNLLDSITSSVDRCSTVTHRLLGFARRMDVRKEQIDLGKLMDEIVGFLGKEMEMRNIQIDFHFPENLPSIESDRGQLQQVFLNLVNNSVAAVDDGGKIDISASEHGANSVAVTIMDNGVGIAKENLEHIFEPFFSTKGEFGTGLGLSITHNIVSKLGGKIDVDSETGEGTSFTVTLPVKNIDYME